MNKQKDYLEFINEELKDRNLHMTSITENVLLERFSTIKQFVNDVRRVYKNVYGWEDEKDEYFLTPMARKFEFSYMIENKNFEIQNISFNSVYDTILHIHFMYTHENQRRSGLTKLQMINICHNGINSGFDTISGYWPKTNNGSITLFLRLGWKIETIRDNTHLYMIGNLREIQETAYKLYCKEKGESQITNLL